MTVPTWDNDKMLINVRTCKVPVIVMFVSAKCVPCKQMVARLEILINEFRNRAVFGMCRADEYTGDFPLSTVPTILININGAVFEWYQGVVDTDKLRDGIETAIERMDEESN